MFGLDDAATASIFGSVLDGLGGLFGGGSSGASKEARHIQYATWQTQQDLAYNGVQRRVEDAKKAGVNPLVALGMNPYQGGVASVVGDTGGESKFSTLAKAGADISRSIAARGTSEERAAARTLAALGVEKAGLENDLLRSQIRSMNVQLPPPMPSANDGSKMSHVKNVLSQLETPLGSADGVTPLHKIVYDKDGDPVQILNPDLNVDSEVLSGAHAAMYTVPQFLWNKTGGRWLTDKLVRDHKTKPWKRQYSKFQK